MQEPNDLTFRKLLVFFIPLGFSASLTSLSHVIINGTLTRGINAEMIIASYAIAHSIFVMMERPVFLIRQTTSALVKDQTSYKAMLSVTTYVIVALIFLSAIIAFTPLGEWFFSTFFDARGEMLEIVISTYSVLLFVSIFSAYRCVYQGLIINRLETKWLTIGMIVRLAVMGGLAIGFVMSGNVNSAIVGAIIFLSGMFVEFVVSIWKGRQLLKQYPVKDEEHDVETKSQVFRFYSPLLFSGGIAVLIIPASNAFMGFTDHVTLAIASFTLAMSIQQLLLSFFMYFHQIVLQFFNRHARKIIKWSALLGVIPTILLGIFSFTPIGPWFLSNLMGASESLTDATMNVLRVFMLKPLLFPVIDFCNGLLMLRKQTNVMFLSQTANVSSTVVTLAILAFLAPSMDGMIAAIGMTVGVLAELIVVLYFVLKGNMPKQMRNPFRQETVST